MTPQELKNSILQLAIQGKLVEQRSGDWKYIRFGDAITLLSGTDFRPDEYNDKGQGIPYITGASSLTEDGVLVNRWTQTPRNIATFGDVLLVCKGSGYGKTVICDVDQAHIARQIMAVKKSDDLDMKYVRFFLMANLSKIKAKGQGVIPGIDRKSILNLDFPLPTLAEQKRIVSKIEELLPYLDRYEQAWTRLETFNKRFPTDMQKSLLQLAIQGKLVEQRSEEGTAEELYQQIQKEKQRLIKEGKIKKEKPLPEIVENEVPFEIPESWKWVRLSNVIDVRDGTHDTPKYVTDGIPLVTSKNLVDGGIVFDSAKLISYEDSQAINMRSRVDDGDILFAMIGTIGNPVLIKKEREFSIKNMALFKQIGNNLLNMEYLLQFLKIAQIDMKKNASASVQSFVSLSLLRNYLFPLPPLAEQKRIVAKLKELLALSEQLKLT